MQAQTHDLTFTLFISPALEPEPPPSPDPKHTSRARPPQQSPGMKAVNGATNAARKANWVAKAAYLKFLREKLAFTQCYIVLTNRGERLGKDWTGGVLRNT